MSLVGRGRSMVVFRPVTSECFKYHCPSSRVPALLMPTIDYPPEILYAVCAAVHDAALPAPQPSLDPLYNADGTSPRALPSAHPPTAWKAHVSRRTLASLCMVSKAWNEAARTWLWRRVEVTLPHSWMALVDQVAGEKDAEEELEVAPGLLDQTLRAALTTCPEDREMELIRSFAAIALPDSSIPPELLSPPASREPSPARPAVRAKSPGRWRLIRTVTDAVQRIVDQSQSGFYGAHRLCSILERLKRRLQFLFLATRIQESTFAPSTSRTSGQLACAGLSVKASLGGLLPPTVFCGCSGCAIITSFCVLTFAFSRGTPSK